MKLQSRPAGTVPRRTFLAGASAFPLCAVYGRPLRAAEFNFKLATGNNDTHPTTTRLKEVATRLTEGSSGRLAAKVFNNYQLGNDADVLSQIRSGALEMTGMSTSILATLVRDVGVLNLGFAFPTYDHVWKTTDGELGDHLRQKIRAAGIIPMGKIWDNGFRQITSSTREIKSPQDLKGLKIRVPPAPLLTSLFKELGAGPTAIGFAEVYTSLQTRVVEAQENPLNVIGMARLYEVQKYLSRTSHAWDGIWMLASRRAMNDMPQDLQTLVHTEFDAVATRQREDLDKMDQELQREFSAKGMTFTDVDRKAFREALNATQYYKQWRAQFGEDVWGKLERSVGALT